MTDSPAPATRLPVLRPIIMFAASLHLVWATLLLIGNDAGHSVTLSELVESTTRFPAAALLAFSSGLALYGITRAERSWWPFIPQQAMLVITSLSVLHAAVAQQTFYGARPWQTIVGGSAAALLLSVFHTLAVSALIAEHAEHRIHHVADVYDRLAAVEDENASLHAELEHRLTLSGGSRPMEGAWPHPERN